MKIIITVIAILFATQSFGQCLGNELAFKDYYKKNVSTLDQIEGIWSTTSVVKIYDQYGALVNTKYNPQLNTLTIIKENGYYLVCSVAGNSRDVETKFYKTATSGIYLYNQFFNKSNSTAKANAILTENGLLEYSYELPVAQLKYDMGSNYVLGYKIISEFKWIKLYPTETEYESFLPSSATGFALSSEGLIATNHHVIKGGNKNYCQRS